MRIMAIDYGDAHTGVAVSDPTGLLAGFTATITAYRPEAVAEQLAVLAREHSAEELVPSPACRWSSGTSGAPPSTPIRSSSTPEKTPGSERKWWTPLRLP